ncbi:MAG TPA: terpene cyclase/mutase family protein [Dehalococcoidia bacterium]|nr:terpene cyclase/mutase family protein [Dehalococcoidia bacterium]
MRGKKLGKPLIGILLVSTLMVTAFATPALANGDFPLEPDDPVITDAVGFLGSDAVQDPATGAIGTYSDSGWAIMAIAAAGEDPNDFGDPSLVDYVKDNAALLASEFNMGTALARIVLAAVAACEDPSAFGPGDPTYPPGGDYISALKALHNGEQFTDGLGAEDTLNDDLWGLLALAAAGEDPDSDIVTSTVNFILFHQNDDGGWGWATTDNLYYSGSDVDDTAAGIMALAAVGFDMTLAEIQHPDYGALAYLRNNQDASGGFLSWGAVSLASTTWAVDAIVAAVGNPTDAQWAPDGINPVEFIMTYRNPSDGSFLDSGAYSPNPQKDTSDALMALTGSFFPITPECAEFVFEDPRRGTKLAIIDSDAHTFCFTAPDGYSSGVIKAKYMRVRRGQFTIIHNDRKVTATFRGNIKRDWCLGLVWDKVNRRFYIIRDPRGVE